MKRVLTMTLTMGLLASASTLAFAQTTNSAAPAAVVTNQPVANRVVSTNRISHANHRSLFQIVGLDPTELRKLAPAQRQAKMKEAIDKRYAELEKKKAKSELTAQEKSDLALLTRIKNHSVPSSRTNSVSHVAPISTNVPAVKAEK